MVTYVFHLGFPFASVLSDPCRDRSALGAETATSSKMNATTETTTHDVHLPVELFSVIGGFLAGDLCFGSLASLNATCRGFYEETLPVLYETIVLQWSDSFCTTLRDGEQAGCST